MLDFQSKDEGSIPSTRSNKMGANVPRLGDDDLQSPCGGFDTHCLHNEFEKLSRFGIVT